MDGARVSSVLPLGRGKIDQLSLPQALIFGHYIRSYGELRETLR